MESGLLGSVLAACAGSPLLQGVAHWLGALGIAPALFLAGLLGSATHCAGMCGPFVLGQIAADREGLAAPGLRELRRLRAALLLPYHLGRLTTYVGLGAVGGGMAGLAAWVSGYRWIPALLLGLAALLFLAQALSGLSRWAGLGGGAIGQALAAPLTRLARPLLDRPQGVRGYLLGVALGFLPCGLLYGALSAAAGSGGAGQGALAMAAFAMGTMPSLILVGYVGVFFQRQAPRLARALGLPVMLANAGFLTFAALRAFG